MQITGGALRKRRLYSPQGKEIRPSASRTREALFNLLLHAPPPPGLASVIVGQRVADLCCGSGLLGFEALSRGAAEALFVDVSNASLGLVRANAEHLGVAKQCRFLLADVARLPSMRESCVVILADPPYHMGLGEKLLRGIVEGGWLAPGGYLALEVAAKEAVPEHPGFAPYKERVYGAAKLAVFTRGTNA